MTMRTVRDGGVLSHVVAFGRAALVVAACAMPRVAAAQACTTGNFTWIHQFGTPATDEAWGIAVDAAANVYVAGNTRDALPGQTSSGAADAFVRKYDRAGSVLWTRQFGTAGDDFAWDVAVDGTGNVYVAGSLASAGRHALLRKYSVDGTVLWTREFGGAFAEAFGVAVDVDAHVYVTGYVFGALPGQISAGGFDAFLRQYDPDGIEIWTDQFGSSGFDQARGVAVNAAGHVYVTGSVVGALPGQIQAGVRDVFVRKYAFDGSVVWTRQFGTSDDDVAAGPAVDEAGNAYVAGGTAGTLPGQISLGSYDAFLRKYDAAGNEVWTRQFGTPRGCPGCSGFDAARGVAVDGVGNVYVTGDVVGPLPNQAYAGGGDAFVRMYDPGGNEVFTKQFGSAFSDSVLDAAVAGGSLLVAGKTFGVLEGQNPGLNWDAFAARLFLRDAEPPSLSVVVSPDTLWPPDHKMVDIQASVEVTDACDPNPIVTLVSVTSNEPDNGVDDGDTANDIEIVDPYTFQLRAERSGAGTGRVYTVTYVATDASGNSSGPVSATVTVPLTKQ